MENNDEINFTDQELGFLCAMFSEYAQGLGKQSALTFSLARKFKD